MLEAMKLYKSYGSKRNRQDVLKGLDIRLEKGEFVAVMGPSGSGKTTLLNVLSSIDQLGQGSIKIDGKELTTMTEKQLATFRKQFVGFIFQDYHLLDTLTVKENILLPLSVQKVTRKAANKAFEKIAKELGIADIQNKYPSEISGGQKQRTAAARAFIHQPYIVFADEPTGALDSKAAADLLDKLSGLQEQHQTTIMMVTHDPVAASYASRIIFIKDGRIYSYLNKGNETREQFLKAIIQTQGVLGGVQNENETTII